jgi:hypothetical protein
MPGKSADESELISSYFSLRGGAAVGLLNVTWPFARLSGGPDALRLSCFRKDYVFDRSNIRSLGKIRGLFSVGLLIEHTVPTYPKTVIFWFAPFFGSNRRHATLKRTLHVLGYPVWDIR